MSTTPKMSKRLLYATVFGVIIIGGAIYISANGTTTIPEQEDASRDTTDTTQIIDSLWQEADTAITEDGAVETETLLTETDILTRSLISPYVEQVRSGAYTKDSGEEIISKITEQVFTLDYTPLNLTAISIIDDISKASTLQYRESMYKAMQPLFTLGEYELTIYARAVQNNSEEDFNKLHSLANTYSSVSDEILLISTPQDISSVHLAIINSLYGFSAVLQDMSRGLDDPAASLSGTGNFIGVEESLTQAFNRLKTYFILKDVANITI